MHSTQCKVYSVEYAVDSKSMQRTVHSIQYTVYDIQYTIGRQYTVQSIQYAVYNIQYTVHSVRLVLWAAKCVRVKTVMGAQMGAGWAPQVCHFGVGLPQSFDSVYCIVYWVLCIACCVLYIVRCVQYNYCVLCTLYSALYKKCFANLLA